MSPEFLASGFADVLFLVTLFSLASQEVAVPSWLRCSHLAWWFVCLCAWVGECVPRSRLGIPPASCFLCDFYTFFDHGPEETGISCGRMLTSRSSAKTIQIRRVRFLEAPYALSNGVQSAKLPIFLWRFMPLQCGGDRRSESFVKTHRDPLELYGSGFHLRYSILT